MIIDTRLRQAARRGAFALCLTIGSTAALVPSPASALVDNDVVHQTEVVGDSAVTASATSDENATNELVDVISESANARGDDGAMPLPIVFTVAMLWAAVVVGLLAIFYSRRKAKSQPEPRTIDLLAPADTPVPADTPTRVDELV